MNDRGTKVRSLTISEDQGKPDLFKVSNKQKGNYWQIRSWETGSADDITVQCKHQSRKEESVIEVI